MMKIKKQLLGVAFGLLACAAPLLAQPDPSTNSVATNNAATNTPGIPAEDPAVPSPMPAGDEEWDFPRSGSDRGPVVVFGRDFELATNQTADTVVVIGGSAKIKGRVQHAVVVIGGDIDVSGQIREAAVAVFGDIRASSGARIDEEAVAVLGRIDAADDVKFRHRPVEIDLGDLGKGLRQWFFQCVLKLRPLAPSVPWVWIVWAGFFMVYLLVALVLAAPVRVCAAELARRPATTFFTGLLMKILIPLIFGILIATGVGIVVVPFLLAALIFGAIVGKVALFELIGSSLGRHSGSQFLQNPIISFLIGIFLITLLYMVPVLGLISLGVVSVWGLGGAVTAAFGGWRKEARDKKIASADLSGPAETKLSSMPPGPSSPPLSGPLTGEVQTQAAAAAAATTAGVAPPPPPANVPEVFAYPRAGFWERMGAGFLDIILISFIVALLPNPPLRFLATLAYFAGLWAWRGTTVGGVVLGLKVVRLDGYPVTFLVSIVRALAAAFSVVVFFLGFLWIVFDREKQAWHDKIAGTAVIKMPRGTPLVLF